MVEIEKLVKTSESTNSGSNINVLDFLKVVDNIITKVDNIEKSKAGRELQQPKVIDVPAPAPVIAQPAPQIIQPQPAPVTQVAVPEAKPVKDKEQIFEKYFADFYKYADLYIMIYGDTTISKMKENLAKDKEQIKKQVLAQF